MRGLLIVVHEKFEEPFVSATIFTLAGSSVERLCPSCLFFITRLPIPLAVCVLDNL